jgi:hypothetical protein
VAAHTPKTDVRSDWIESQHGVGSCRSRSAQPVTPVTRERSFTDLGTSRGGKRIDVGRALAVLRLTGGFAYFGCAGERMTSMYRDVAQWSSIRDQVLRKGVSIRRIIRETGISRKTGRKMLDHPLPQPYGPRSGRYPKLGRHTSSVQRMLQENATLPPSARLSIKAIYERIRDAESFRGSYGCKRRRKDPS